MPEIDHKAIHGGGEERLWAWFGLSYANFLVLPRTVLHSMPNEWQGQMAALLDQIPEYLDTSAIPEPEGGYRVQAVDLDNRLIKMDRRLCDRRRQRWPSQDSMKRAEPPGVPQNEEEARDDGQRAD